MRYYACIQKFSFRIDLRVLQGTHDVVCSSHHAILMAELTKLGECKRKLKIVFNDQINILYYNLIRILYKTIVSLPNTETKCL